jgi:hypothetical protein
VLVPWWNNNAFNRHIYIGHAVYKVNADADVNWTHPSQINNQIRLNRQQANVSGSTFFRTGNLMANPLSVRDSLSQYMYTKPALLPAMSWKDNTAPQPASNLSANVLNNTVSLTWTKTPFTTNETDKARQYVIYRFNTSSVDLNDVNAILHVTPNDVNSYTDTNVAPGTYYYAVTALDRFHNESSTSNTASVSVLTTQVESPELRTLNFRIYPNPVTATAYLSFELTKPSNVSIVLYDVYGKQVLHVMNGKRMLGINQIPVPVSTLQAGTYFVTLRSDTFSKTIRVVITR